SAATGVIGGVPANADALIPSAGIGTRTTTETSAPGQAFSILTAEQAFLLTLTLNRLIPASQDMPAAGDVDITSYVDVVLADAPHLRRPILGLIGDLPRGEAMNRLTDVEIDTLLARLQSAHSDNFNALLHVAYTGYYSHPIVLAKIGWTSPDS